MISNAELVRLQMKNELLEKRLAQLSLKNTPVMGEVAEKYQLFRFEDDQFKLWGIMQLIKRVEIRKAG
jgi:hypothetical protein